MRPPGGMVITARGATAEGRAMMEAFREQRIAGGPLDVFAPEPLPPENPLWSLENVIITPHASGDSPRVGERTIALFAENLRRYKAGEPLLNQVDLAQGY